MLLGQHECVRLNVCETECESVCHMSEVWEFAALMIHGAFCKKHEVFNIKISPQELLLRKVQRGLKYTEMKHYEFIHSF